jgi:tetratricopeptide (TPR) repeat protein
MVEPYPYYTLVKIYIARLHAAFAADSPEQTIENLAREAERHLLEGKERFPDNAELQKAESKLHETLSESEKAFKALRKSFELNPRNPFIAIRLAEYHRRRNEPVAAVEVVTTALMNKRTDPKLNFAYARMLMDDPKSKDEDILYHLSRSYTLNDPNYEAQLLHARQLFLIGDLNESNKLFRQLKQIRMPFGARFQTKYPLSGRFTGRIVRLDTQHYWVERDGDVAWIFGRRDTVHIDTWGRLTTGTPVSFGITFNMAGPFAFDLAIA